MGVLKTKHEKKGGEEKEKTVLFYALWLFWV